MSFIIDGKPVEPPAGLIVKSYKEDGLFRFVNRKRHAPPNANAVVVHETVTTSHGVTVAVLKARGLGVHLIVDHDGIVYQHADLLTDEMWHATQFNALSVGIETVNPYDPKFLPKTGSPWTDVINAPWAAGATEGRGYVVPTLAESIAVTSTLNFLTSALANPVAIPQHWPGFQGTHRLALGRVKADVVENPGIHAHMYFGHADGAWLVLFAWLTMEAGLSYEDAYAKAKELATGASSAGIDLDPYFQANPFLET